MKKSLFLLLILLSLNHLSFSQNLVQPSDGKSIVYFMPTYIEYTGSDNYMAITGKGRIEWMDTQPFLILFDNETYLGNYDGWDNVYYECDPGYHLFWFGNDVIYHINAELLTNNIYVIYFPIQYIPPLAPFLQKILDPSYPYNGKLFPVNKVFDSCEFIGFSDYATLRLKENKHSKISKVIPTSQKEIKKNAELIRKSKILYKYKLRVKEDIPQLLPDMYIENSEKG